MAATQGVELKMPVGLQDPHERPRRKTAAERRAWIASLDLPRVRPDGTPVDNR